ncbi:MAG: dephospho-CoA kinase [candidate division NC10 bacterium]|nr:dephospho-CoA kinase [candidate division NC10 bacterium]
MLVVGLTGGICSGKSTVAAMFERLGAVVIDADRVAHELQAPGQPLFRAIVSAFGRQIVGEDGRIDRRRLGAIVFSDHKARARLQEILHPAIVEECERRIQQARASGAAVCLLDAALLIESGRHARFDRMVLVEASEAVQLERLIARMGLSREEAMQRIRSQMPPEEKRRHAKFVIENGGSLNETERQVRAVWEQLRIQSS